MSVFKEKIEKRQMKDVPEMDTNTNSRTAEAWEAFTDSNENSQTSVRDVISESWVKSRQADISHDQQRAETVISAEQLEQINNTNDLCIEAIPMMDGMADLVSQTKHVLVLADSEGVLLHSVGNSKIREKLEKINFMPGADWNEQAVGTNGVGTPLTLERPEVVMGYEHYCKGWHPWVCYGAPIYAPNGKSIRGLIDVTGPVKKINKEAMLMALSVAQTIESKLTAQELQRRDVLREIGKGRFKRWSSDGVIILDEHGVIVDYNSKAVRYMNQESTALLNQPLADVIVDLSDCINECLVSKAIHEKNIHLKKQSGLLLPVKVRFEPVIKAHRCIGMALVLSDLTQQTKTQGKLKPAQYNPQSRYTFDNVRGSSEKLKKTISMAQAAAADPLESNVLLIGETGTGKELLAHSIHSESQRANAPFVALNCAAIPSDLIESELFGYVAGAFTGASREGRKGKFEAAHTGTLFLDEINSMSLELQAKFLRVLDFMEFTPIGGTAPILVNVRVIAAANEKIHTAVDDGLFRLDLFHRLGVLEISIPSLSERGNDIIQLANEFLRDECQAAGRDRLMLSDEVMKLMQSHAWPGNIRELYNNCVRWVLTVDGNSVNYEHLPERMTRNDILNQPIISENLRTISDELIKRTLKQTNNNVSKAARILGIDRSTIYRRRAHW